MTNALSTAPFGKYNFVEKLMNKDPSALQKFYNSINNDQGKKIIQNMLLKGLVTVPNNSLKIIAETIIASDPSFKTFVNEYGFSALYYLESVECTANIAAQLRQSGYQSIMPSGYTVKADGNWKKYLVDNSTSTAFVLMGSEHATGAYAMLAAPLHKQNFNVLLFDGSGNKTTTFTEITSKIKSFNQEHSKGLDITIVATHGYHNKQGEHFIVLNKNDAEYPNTRKLFDALKEGNKIGETTYPLHVLLTACSGQVAVHAARHLPPGSSLATMGEVNIINGEEVIKNTSGVDIVGMTIAISHLPSTLERPLTVLDNLKLYIQHPESPTGGPTYTVVINNEAVRSVSLLTSDAAKAACADAQKLQKAIHTACTVGGSYNIPNCINNKEILCNEILHAPNMGNYMIAERNSSNYGTKHYDKHYEDILSLQLGAWVNELNANDHSEA